MEEWKPVVGYEADYAISTRGDVYDMKNQRYVFQVIAGVKGNDYWYVNLRSPDNDRAKRKLVRVHILVAKAFLPPSLGADTVDHIDRDRFNNQVSNLRWVSKKENTWNRKTTVYVNDQGTLTSMLHWFKSLGIQFAYSRCTTAFKGVKEVQAEHIMEFLENKYYSNKTPVPPKKKRPIL